MAKAITLEEIYNRRAECDKIIAAQTNAMPDEPHIYIACKEFRMSDNGSLRVSDGDKSILNLWGGDDVARLAAWITILRPEAVEQAIKEMRGEE